MDDNIQNLNDMNAIAFDGSLRDKLKTLHDMLGDEVTDVATNAYEFGIRFNSDSEKILKYMSSIASKLTLALMKARKSKENLSPEEQEDFDKIVYLTTVLGNLQDRLNTVINLSKQINDLNFQINEASIKLADEIMDSQEKFREVRANIDAYGFLSTNPELARLFEDSRQQEINQ